uniref:Uncharacterized protein n=1 Tax=Lactuca sativa TaxID=4236 RepID=A0A9R1UTW8_LACSA|nr:hypothetical protein LSAT_V11C800428290 [Lactuca sativa]
MYTFGHWSSTRVLFLEFSTAPSLNCLFKQRETNWSSLRCLISLLLSHPASSGQTHRLIDLIVGYECDALIVATTATTHAHVRREAVVLQNQVFGPDSSRV